MRIDILDHGYVEVVESWGGDDKVIEAARMSTGKGFLGWGPRCRACKTYLGDKDPGHVCCGRDADIEPGDEKLLRFLHENRHATPFEFAGLVIEVQAPIIVFREWHRHRTQSYNEASARYAPLPAVDYVPNVQRMLIGGGHLTKQAGAHGDGVLTERLAAEWLNELAEVQAHAERIYQLGLRMGVPKELARLSMTVGRYSKMRASANLRNWLGFLALRMAPNAQWEIRQYANAVGEILTRQFPRTMALFAEDHRG